MAQRAFGISPSREVTRINSSAQGASPIFSAAILVGRAIVNITFGFGFIFLNNIPDDGGWFII